MPLVWSLIALALLTLIWTGIGINQCNEALDRAEAGKEISFWKMVFKGGPVIWVLVAILIHNQSKEL